MKTNNKIKAKKAAEKTGFNRWLAGAIIALTNVFGFYSNNKKRIHQLGR